jgi:steroid 5-alpha reductase family enzyme
VTERGRAIALVVLAYVVAGAAALAVYRRLAGAHPLEAAAAADFAATVVVFAFSYFFDNSSFYDPYWSVAPPLIGLYWAGLPLGAGASVARQAMVLALVTAWAVRLTYNWLRGWTGLHHEDWRYVDMRAQSGRAYWVVSFLGIHLVPTIIVFLGCLSLYPALSTGTHAVGWLDLLAFVVTAAAILIETTADQQLRRFRATAPAPGSTLASGLWAYSRHPNYFGEALFWWGLFFFGVAADPATWWWTIAGPLAVTLMFLFISIPMIDRRMLARRPDYAARMAHVSALVLWPPR